MVEIVHGPFRPAVAADVSALAALYVNCAVTFGPTVYSPEQVVAWRSFGDDLNSFHGYVLQARTWVADDAVGQAVGFCGVTAEGEVLSLYVRPDAARQGLGGRLLDWAIQRAREHDVMRFAAWATPFSRPVFERRGFVLERVSHEPYQGVMFDRYRMVRD